MYTRYSSTHWYKKINEMKLLFSSSFHLSTQSQNTNKLNGICQVVSLLGPWKKVSIPFHSQPSLEILVYYIMQIFQMLLYLLYSTSSEKLLSTRKHLVFTTADKVFQTSNFHIGNKSCTCFPWNNRYTSCEETPYVCHTPI